MVDGELQPARFSPRFLVESRVLNARRHYLAYWLRSGLPSDNELVHSRRGTLRHDRAEGCPGALGRRREGQHWAANGVARQGG